MEAKLQKNEKSECKFEWERTRKNLVKRKSETHKMFHFFRKDFFQKTVAFGWQKLEQKRQNNQSKNFEFLNGIAVFFWLNKVIDVWVKQIVC